MANLIFPYSSAPLKTVEEIQFGLMSPEEIKNMSVAHILYPETMEDNGTKPRDGGLNDPLLGSIDRQYKCKTCNQAMNDCPGHFGHIELAKPVYHPGFIKKVKKILEIVCHNCSKVLSDTVSLCYFLAKVCELRLILTRLDTERPRVRRCYQHAGPEASLQPRVGRLQEEAQVRERGSPEKGR